MKLYEALFPAILIILPGATMKTGNVSPPPATPRQPVTDVYHGISVSDDYRWLDDYNRPEVRAWSNAQNAYTRSIIDSIPSAAAVRARVADVLRDASPRWSHLVRRGRTLFALKSAPPKEQPFIVAMDSPDDAGAQRVVFDPDRIDPNGTTAIDFFVPSPDGRYVAVSLSQGGTEAGSVHVYETAVGR